MIYQSAEKKKKKNPTKNTLHGKVMIQNWRKNKSFADKQKLKEFITTKPALREMLKGFL